MINNINLNVLLAICPERTAAELAPWVEPMKIACWKFEINNIRRVSAYIAQMSHESQLKPGREENLSYRAKRMTEVWSGRFPTIASAKPYERNPEKLANKVYADRMGNGNEASGDGWRYRGGGPLQVTGKANWSGFAADMKMPVEKALVYGRTLEGGIMAAAWFWEENGINRLADTPGVSDESKRINGGLHGLADRTNRFNAGVEALLRAERK